MNSFNHWLLTILLLIPAAGGLAVLQIRPARAVRHAAISIAIGVFCGWLLVLTLLQNRHGSYDYAPAGSVQMLCSVEIVPAIHWNYRVAIDGLSLPFCIVTSLITLLACAMAPHGRQRVQWFFATILWLETLALGIFICFDLLLLWTFLALFLIPCCGLLALEQSEHAGRAIVVFLISMLVGLACLFVGILGVRIWSTHCLVGGTLDLVRLASLGCAEPSLFLLMLIGFLAMLPVFPLHLWIPAVAQSGSIASLAMIVGVTPMIGGYGLLRVLIPLFPNVAASIWWLPAALGSFMILYCALCAVGTEDSRNAVVYLILSMGGFVLVGVASLAPIGLSGAMTILIAQGLVAPFLIAMSASVIRATGHGESQRGPFALTVPIWLTELMLPGFVGVIMIVLGMVQAGGSGWSTSRLVIIGVVCLGVMLNGVAGVQILRRGSKMAMIVHSN